MCDGCFAVYSLEQWGPRFLYVATGFERERAELEMRNRQLKARFDTELQQRIEETIHAEVEKQLRGDPFRVYMRQLVLAEIREAMAKSSAGSVVSYVEKLAKEEIQRQILSKLNVDLKISLVEPPDGVNRNVISPEDNDPVGEPREA